VASCQVVVEQDRPAFAQSCPELDLLKQAARWLFRELVAQDPLPFLLTVRREHGVALEFKVGLFRQARDAEVLGAAKDASASAWIDDYRAALVRARGGSRC
jgi:hypothetical protein